MESSQVSVDDKGLTFTAPDDDVTLRIGGRVHLDAGAAAIAPQSLGPPLNDILLLRRAWFESYLTLSKDLEVAFQYDFADPMRPVKDVAIGYRGLDATIVTVGQMKEPLSLESLTSSNDTLFVERSLADALVPGRSLGAAVGISGERWTLVTSAFGGNANAGVTEAGAAVAARATYAPILEEREVLHLGFAGSMRGLGRGSEAPSFASRPETNLFATSRQFVDTGSIDGASRITRLGVEAAYQRGPLRIQAEYIVTRLDRFGPARAMSFQGGYIELGFVLNGDGRPYAIKPDYGAEYAVFGPVHVSDDQRLSRGGFGVFEFGARFSALDLDSAGLRGGEERNLTVGLNWYPERTVRVMANYIRADSAPSALRGGRAVSANIVVGRLQIAW